MRGAHQRVARARVRVAEREVAAEGLVPPIDLGAAVDQHAQSPDVNEREEIDPKCHVTVSEMAYSERKRGRMLF